MAFLCLMLASGYSGIEHLGTRTLAGSPPVKITSDSELDDKKVEIEQALSDIQKAKKKNPDYFHSLTDKLESKTVNSVVGGFNEFVGGTKKLAETSKLTVKNFVYWGLKKVDGTKVDMYNATIDAGYAAKVAIIQKPVQLFVWGGYLFLLGILFSMMLYTSIDELFRRITISLGDNFYLNLLIQLANYLIKGFQCIVAALPCGGLILWIAESIFEAKAGSMLGFDNVVSAIYSFPDAIELTYYQNHNYRDSIVIPILMLIALVIFWIVMFKLFIKMIEPYLPEIIFCSQCKQIIPD